ncbi:MAG: UDP-3-O-(3-hydroxymyristoyl)glucosamine N-acyltransferase [Acidobacteriia bacterium]|nr:UDP-3-O-(3-hydroxymyristoyl)glucosamine N-acyltransferase [Terriglobia bacterium]
MKRSLKEVAELVQARLVGDGAVAVSGISSIGSASTGDLVFVEDERCLRLALESPAAAVIAGEFATEETAAKPLLVCAQPRLAFARAAKALSAAAPAEPGVHASAVVHASARLGKDVNVEARVVIAEGAVIGDRTTLGAGSVIGAKASIGSDCQLYPNVTIYPGARLGDRVTVHAGAVLGSDGFGYVCDRATGRYEKFPQVGRLEIGDDVEIGANTTVDRGALDVTRIGRGTKLDNLVHIGHNCQLGENVVIAAQAGLSGSIVVESNVVLGGQVGIGEHARIEEGVMLGGQGGVLPHKVLRGKGVAFWGTPAKPVREYLKELAALAKLARKA